MKTTRHKQSRRSSFFSWLRRVIKWLYRVKEFKKTTNWTVSSFNPLLDKLEKIYNTRGPVALIRYVKDVRAIVLVYLARGDDISSGLQVKTTTDHIPVCLGPLIPSIRERDNEVIPYLTTILWSTRCLSCGKQVDLESITRPNKFIGPNDLPRFTFDFWKEIGYFPSKKRVPKRLLWQRFHFTTKSGPNGHALGSALADLVSLPISLVRNIIILGGSKINEAIRFNLVAYDLGMHKEMCSNEPYADKSGSFRKITSFPDKEEKVRTIAILDYFSQSVLRPLHMFLSEALKRIPQDCTYDQGSFKEKVMNEEIYYSIDLSSATDRFPISLITSVLEGLLPSWYVSAWRNIMVEHPFEATSEINGKGVKSSIKYAVGNPMGAYSSWVSFALAHHYVVYYCCRKLGLDWSTTSYCLLGDDILICNQEVAELYIEVLSQLGVEVSMSKTHKSAHLAEFAKRLIHNGAEVTQFPVSSLKESRRKYYFLTNLLMQTQEKGWNFSIGIPESLGLYYEIVEQYSSKRRAKLVHKSRLCELMLKHIRGSIDAHECINTIAGIDNPLNRYFTEEECRGILSNLIVELFADSDPDRRSERPDFITRKCDELLDALISSSEKGEEDIQDIIEHGLYDRYLPALSVMIGLTDSYLKVRKKALDNDTLSAGEWDFSMKHTQIPTSGTVFSQRAQKVIIQGSVDLVHRITERLNLIRMYQM